MLLRAYPSTSSHTRPQLREHDDAFVAVERPSTHNILCRICRGGEEKFVYSQNFPPTVGDVDVERLESWMGQQFYCPLWREGDCGAGAGGGSWSWGGAAARARV